MTWAEAFNNVGIAVAIAAGTTGFFWALGRLR